MLCPSCGWNIAYDSSVYGGVYCPQCNSHLFVSRRYITTIAVACWLLVWAGLWYLSGAEDPFRWWDWLAIPLSTPVAALALRVIPKVWPPLLVLRNFENFVTLDIDGWKDEEDVSNYPTAPHKEAAHSRSP